MQTRTVERLKTKPGIIGQTDHMPLLRPDPKRQPEQHGGEGWLVHEAQQLLIQFKPDTPTVQSRWVSLRTFKWAPPQLPVPHSQRRMLRNNAIEAWNTMLQSGWRRCHPPVR